MNRSVVRVLRAVSLLVLTVISLFLGTLAAAAADTPGRAEAPAPVEALGLPMGPLLWGTAGAVALCAGWVLSRRHGEQATASQSG